MLSKIFSVPPRFRGKVDAAIREKIGRGNSTTQASANHASLAAYTVGTTQRKEAKTQEVMSKPRPKTDPSQLATPRKQATVRGLSAAELKAPANFCCTSS